MKNVYSDQAIRLMRRSILLTSAGKWNHARGQLAAARGNLILAEYAIRERSR